MGHWGERKHRTVSKTFWILLRNCRALLLLRFALWIGPCLWCCMGSSQQQRVGFCVGERPRNHGAAWAASGILLERPTALGREALETPVGMRALKARALLLLKMHKGALFPEMGLKCWLQLSMAQFSSHPRAWVLEFLYNVCSLFD